jgi:hypothetical protein
VKPVSDSEWKQTKSGETLLRLGLGHHLDLCGA